MGFSGADVWTELDSHVALSVANVTYTLSSELGTPYLYAY
jgi:hypothetical protein